MGNGYYVLCGALTFDSVPHLWREGLSRFEDAAKLTLDLQEVTHTDSAGLALMVEWMREAKRRNSEIHFRNIPSQMLAIASTSRLEQLFPQE